MIVVLNFISHFEFSIAMMKFLRKLFTKSTPKSMQRASHAGSWYPTGSSLTNMLRSAFSQATVSSNSPGKVKAIVVPHAGYVYCVSTSAHSFKAVDTSLFKRAVIIGPSHRIYVTHCTIADASGIETPFGPIPFDNDTANELISKYPDLFRRLDRRTSEQEHSLEMECPLLKYIFGEKPLSVIPIMIGAISDETAKKVAQALEPIVNDDQTLLVVSSDFSHWGRDFDYTYLPDVQGSINERIEALDREGMEKVSTCDVKQFAEFIRRTGDTICGEVPIKIAMQAIHGKYNVEWPHYSQSSPNLKSERESNVSYASGIFRVE